MSDFALSFYHSLPPLVRSACATFHGLKLLFETVQSLEEDLQHMLDERPRFEALFSLADRSGNGESVTRAQIDAVLDRALAPEAANETTKTASRTPH